MRWLMRCRWFATPALWLLRRGVVGRVLRDDHIRVRHGDTVRLMHATEWRWLGLTWAHRHWA